MRPSGCARRGADCVQTSCQFRTGDGEQGKRGPAGGPGPEARWKVRFRRVRTQRIFMGCRRAGRREVKTRPPGGRDAPRNRVAGQEPPGSGRVRNPLGGERTPRGFHPCPGRLEAGRSLGRRQVWSSPGLPRGSPRASALRACRDSAHFTGGKQAVYRAKKGGADSRIPFLPTAPSGITVG